MRDELDERRRSALLAIFNEKHYPYPYQRGSKTYTQVQQEIDERVARVREVWDDDFQVKINRKGPLARLLGEWDAALTELQELEEDVGELEQTMAPYVAYATGEPFTVREYFKNDGERKLFAYNRWVMGTYNPKQDREATQPERRQTEVTNEYRMMMGYAAAVTPGAAPYEAIDDDTVAKILDEGRIEQLVPLRAVRDRGPPGPLLARRTARTCRSGASSRTMRPRIRPRAPRAPARSTACRTPATRGAAPPRTSPTARPVRRAPTSSGSTPAATTATSSRPGTTRASGRRDASGRRTSGPVGAVRP